MSNIKIVFKDKTEKEFKHEGRAGGSYTKVLKLENGFVIVIDEWDNRTIYPADDIRSIEERPNRNA